jgi:outer membrane protein insertion porin family
MYVPAAKNTVLIFIIIAAPVIFLASCTTVKNYPKNRPFVYDTNIQIEGKYSTDEKKELESKLYQQLHDSIRVLKQQKFIFWQSLKNPPAYDSLNASKSRIFMSALLKSEGYYRDSISFTDTVKVEGDQQRTTVNFVVIPGKLTRFDSIWYDLLDSVAYSPDIDTLQQLTLNAQGEKLIKKGDPFSKPMVSSELDRLADVYRNNGYLRFSKELLIAVWDTVGRELISPFLDPIEMAAQMEALRQRRENPTTDLEIRLKPNPDTNRLRRYYVGQVRIYPDLNVDTAYYVPKIFRDSLQRFEFISYAGLFNPRKLIRFIYLRRGDLYAQTNYLRTQNKFNSLTAWRLVTINQFPRDGQDTVDFEIRLLPADKYNTSINFDVSRNQGNIASEGNLIGLGGTFSLINRNFLKAANQSVTNFRYGVELSSNIDSLIQTRQFSLSHTIQFPRLVPRLQWLPRDTRDDARTFLSLNVAQTRRLQYYDVASFNAAWGYEFNWKKTILGLRFPNIEYNSLKRQPRLQTLIDSNRSYQYIFNDGLIISSLVNVSIANAKKNLTTLKRISVETAGIISGLLKKPLFPNSKLYRFVKLDAEITQTYKIRRTALAWRVFGGLGYGMPFSKDDGTKDSTNVYMPFFRQYYAGGPNSMRGWSVRKLGPGSSIKSFDPNQAPDRFGDVRLEGNFEYRFYMTQFFGYPLEGAVFTDVGNVWFMRKNNDFENGEFKLGRLWKDLAVAMGYGLRIDFGFLKARFDFAYKAKDPSPAIAEAQNKWFYKWTPFFSNKDGKRGAQFQLGINYPF